MLSPEIVEFHIKRFGRPPDAYYAQPEMTARERIFYRAYRELSTNIQIEGGYIPLDSILAFCDRYNIDFFPFLNIIRAIEEEMFKIRDEERERENAKNH